jgi:UDP-GlcNAc:undecaprenyl-phosphate/decaprenyl-phosphate GlcNAc-1-phosphate transferase
MEAIFYSLNIIFMNPLAAAVTAFTLAILLFPLVIKYLYRWELTDKPGVRKVHKAEKPSFGGAPVFVSYLFAALVWVNLSEWKSIKFILLAQIFIIIFGLRDDLHPLRPIHKLFGQIMASGIVIFLLDLRIQSLYGFMGVQEIPVVLSYLLTFVVIIGITNSFNLIDGIDGLAGTVASIVFLTLGVWFYLIDDKIYATVAFAMLGGLLAFLFFNWQPSKIFMGDTGSLFIGITLSMFVIHFMNVNEQLPVSNPFKFINTIAAAFCFLMPPIVDTLRVIMIRVLKGYSPFRPDKSHIHHAFIRMGLTHNSATLIIAGVHVLFISLAVLSSKIADVVVVPAIISLAVLFSVALDRLIINHTRKSRNDLPSSEGLIS